MENQFVRELQSLTPSKEFTKLFSMILKNDYDPEMHKQTNPIEVSKRLTLLFNRGINAGKLHAQGILENDDYQLIKTDCENRINGLGKDLDSTARTLLIKSKSIARQSKMLSKIDEIYQNSEPEIKKKLVTLLFTDRSIFEASFEGMYNTSAKIVYGLGSDLDKQVKGPLKNISTDTGDQQLFEWFRKIKKCNSSQKINPIQFRGICLFLRKFNAITNEQN